MILNFKKKITFDDILDKDLLKTSIKQAKNHEIVKNKMKEQIISNLNKIDTPIDNKLESEFEADLAQVQNDDNNENYEPYDGGQYSFI